MYHYLLPKASERASEWDASWGIINQSLKSKIVQTTYIGRQVKKTGELPWLEKVEDFEEKSQAITTQSNASSQTCIEFSVYVCVCV